MISHNFIVFAKILTCVQVQSSVFQLYYEISHPIIVLVVHYNFIESVEIKQE